MVPATKLSGDNELRNRYIWVLQGLRLKAIYSI